MTNTTKNVLLAVGAILVLVVGFLWATGHFSSQPTVGQVSYDRLDQVGDFTQGINRGVTMSNGQIRIGTSTASTYLSKFIKTTCNASTTALPLAATSSIAMTCTITGAAVGDAVEVDLAANPTAFGTFSVGNPRVTSANTVSFGILNFTGTATSSFPLATTSVIVSVWR